MAIASLNDYIGAAKQRIEYCKTPGRTTVATGWFSGFDLAGYPGAGTLAGSSTASGIVPGDTLAGYPTLNAFGATATGYISKIEFGSTVACRVCLYDRLFVAGAYSFTQTVTLSSIPSYSGRLPNTDYKNLEIWVEQVTAATGNQAVNVTYTNESGTVSHTTGAVGIGAAPTVGRCWQLPLQAGDRGVTQITGVTGTVATAGTFNVMVLRPLWTSGRVRSANDGDIHDMLRVGLPQVYATSALYVLIAADSTAFGVPDLTFEVSNA